MAEFGENIRSGDRVEISPHIDLWMRGARFGEVKDVLGIMALVRMDHPQVKKLQEIPVADLKRT